MVVTATRDRFGGPRWEIPWGPSAASVRSLRTRAAGRWYLGAGFSLLWMATVAPDVLAASPTALSKVCGVALMVVFSAAFVLSAPVAWILPGRARLAPAGILLALSFTMFPWIGWDVRGMWTYVGVAVAMAALPLRTTWIALGAVGALALLAGWLMDGWTESVLWVPAVIVSVSAMMAAFARSLAAINELRATRDQMAVLAVERERSRVARDIHDILGHSLTVVTVKAELAGRLVDVDPDRARTEIAEVEALARGALADVRATVAGYRGVSISGELAAARVALDAAGVAAELPGSTDAVPPERRELAGWVVREGVTNVLRHAGAAQCRIRLGAHGVSIEDDGVGPTPGVPGGSGLAGVRERAEAAGGAVTVGRGELGGFRLAVTW